MLARRTAGVDRIGEEPALFGDGWQISKMIDGTRYWRVPTMDEEFVGEETTFVVKAVGGGNLLILARHRGRAGRGRSRRGGDAWRAGRDHAVSGRGGALGFQGRQQVRQPVGLDQ